MWSKEKSNAISKWLHLTPAAQPAWDDISTTCTACPGRRQRLSTCQALCNFVPGAIWLQLCSACCKKRAEAGHPMLQAHWAVPDRDKGEAITAGCPICLQRGSTQTGWMQLCTALSQPMSCTVPSASPILAFVLTECSSFAGPADPSCTASWRLWQLGEQVAWGLGGGGETCLVTTTKRQAQKSKALQTLCSSPFFQAWVKTNGPGYSNTAAPWWLAAASLLAMLVVIQAYFATTMSFHTDLSIPRKTTCPL